MFNLLHKIRNEQGVPLDFIDHLFLFDIYGDWSQKLVCMKAAQIGFSTLAINKSLYAAKHKKWDIIYTLPTGADVHDFVGAKVNRIIEQNKIFKHYVSDRDTVEQKKVGDNIIYYRGTFTEKAAIMVSSDLNIHDEEDRSNPETLEVYASRLQHSKFKGEWHFSNPSAEGHGVSRYWAKSDQKHWFIRCGTCRRNQYLSWPDSIDQERRCFQCKSCHAPLRRGDRAKGEWVKRFKDREFSGYWIPLLLAPWVTAGEIIDYFNNKPRDYFYNFVLGLPYIGEGNTVPEHTIYGNLTEKVNSQEDVVIGCDSGLIKHYVVGNKEGIFFYGKTETWDDIRKLLRRFQRSIAVIDHLPDLTEPRKMVEEFPGRVFLGHYSQDRKSFQLIRWGKDAEFGNVTIDRNRVMQLLIDEFADRRIPLQGVKSDWEEYYAHWKTLYRMNDTDIIGNPTFKWETSTGQDHWCHATLFWRAGMDKQANIGGGSILGIQHNKFPTAPTIAPDGTIPAPDLSRPKKSDDWRL